MSKYKITLSSFSDLLDKWNKRAREAQFSHYRAEIYFRRIHKFLGLPATLFASLTGASVYVEVQNYDNPAVDFFIAVFSFLTVILVSMQTFLKLSELAERHISSAARYGALRRRIEELKVGMIEGVNGVELRKEIELIRVQLDNLAESSPNVSKKIREKAIQVMEVEDER